MALSVYMREDHLNIMMTVMCLKLDQILHPSILKQRGLLPAPIVVSFILSSWRGIYLIKQILRDKNIGLLLLLSVVRYYTMKLIIILNAVLAHVEFIRGRTTRATTTSEIRSSYNT
jgi:hypothetical protein